MCCYTTRLFCIFVFIAGSRSIQPILRSDTASLSVASKKSAVFWDISRGIWRIFLEAVAKFNLAPNIHYISRLSSICRLLPKVKIPKHSIFNCNKDDQNFIPPHGHIYFFKYCGLSLCPEGNRRIGCKKR